MTLSTSPNVQYRKYGSVVCVKAWGSGDYDIGGGAWKTIATLPSGFRPSISVVPVLNGAGATLNGISASLNTNGELDLYCTNTSATYWNAYVCYIV